MKLRGVGALIRGPEWPLRFENGRLSDEEPVDRARRLLRRARRWVEDGLRSGAADQAADLLAEIDEELGR